LIAHRRYKQRAPIIDDQRRANIVRERLRDKNVSDPALYLNSIDNFKPSLPVECIQATHGTNGWAPIDALIDSGAIGDFAPVAEAHARGLTILPCSMSVRVGDNHSITAVGKATFQLQIGNRTIDRSVVLLKDCPYALILGCNFFYEYIFDILFSTYNV
jgi:hypothetical protein